MVEPLAEPDEQAQDVAPVHLLTHQRWPTERFKSSCVGVSLSEEEQAM